MGAGLLTSPTIGEPTIRQCNKDRDFLQPIKRATHPEFLESIKKGRFEFLESIKRGRDGATSRPQAKQPKQTKKNAKLGAARKIGGNFGGNFQQDTAISHAIPSDLVDAVSTI